MIPLENIVDWLRRLESARIPSPVWVEKKQVFEYEKITVETVAFLKTARAVQSLHSLPLLCQAGLFIDYETIIRCIYECCYQVEFLLEDYPNLTPAAVKFIEHFSKTTIDEHSQHASLGVSSKKIHSANARALEKAGFSFDESKKLYDRTYKAMSSATHSLYASIMQIYGGAIGYSQYQVGGVPSIAMKNIQSQWIETANLSVAQTILHMAIHFGVKDVASEILICLPGDD